MIRDATQQDIETLVSIATEFNNQYYHVPLNKDKFTNAIKFMIDSDQCVVLLSDTGAILGTFAEDPFRDWLSLVEVGWYSSGGDGVRLLEEFEKRGKDADEVRMCTLHTSPEVAEFLLLKRGYKPVEKSYTLMK